MESTQYYHKQRNFEILLFSFRAGPRLPVGGPLRFLTSSFAPFGRSGRVAEILSPTDEPTNQPTNEQGDSRSRKASQVNLRC